MGFDRYKLEQTLNRNCQEDKPAHQYATLTGLARTYAAAKANENLYKELVNTLYTPDFDEEDGAQYISWLKAQYEIIDGSDFSGAGIIPLRTNKLKPLLKELIEELENNDNDINKLINNMPDFADLADNCQIPEHGAAEHYWLGTAKATIYSTFMITVLKYFTGKDISAFNIDSPLLERYKLDEGVKIADSPENKFCFTDNGNIYIPHQGFAFGRGGDSKAIAAKDAGSWVQEALAIPETKTDKFISTSHWYKSFAEFNMAQEAINKVVDTFKSPTEFKASCEFLEEKFVRINIEDVAPGDIHLSKRAGASSEPGKKIFSPGHIGVINSEINSTEVHRLSTDRTAEEDHLGSVDGFGIGSKELNRDKIEDLFMRPTEDHNKQLANSVEWGIDNWNSIASTIRDSSVVYDSGVAAPKDAYHCLTELGLTGPEMPEEG